MRRSREEIKRERGTETNREKGKKREMDIQREMGVGLSHLAVGFGLIFKNKHSELLISCCHEWLL